MLGLILGTLLNLIIIPIAIVIGIPFLIGVLIYQKVKVHRAAEARLREILENKA